MVRIFFLLFLCSRFAWQLSAEKDHMPGLGLGTAGMPGSTTDIVNAALDMGVKLIDTAQAKEWYDEEAVGVAVRAYYEREKKDDLYVVTKIHPRSYGLEDMRTQLERSTNNLGRGGIDAILLHAPFCWQGHCTKAQEEVGWKQAWKNLESLQDEYDLSALGVSNMVHWQLEELVLQIADRKVAVVQNWMDPFHQDTDVRAFCAEHGIVYMAYSSFGTQWGHAHLDENPVFSSEVLQNIAARHQATVTQVVLAWLSFEGVVAIPRSTKLDHLQDNFSICDAIRQAYNPCAMGANLRDAQRVQLTDEDVEEIRALDNSIPWD